MSEQQSAGMSSETRRGVIRWAVREVMGSVMAGVLLFWPAGTLRWVWGWVLIAVYLAWSITNAILFIPTNPELLAERGARRKDAKRWDTVLMSVVGVLTLVKYIVAGLDFRNGWTGEPGIAVHIIALGVGLAGYALVTWAMASNAYFSTIVRIQSERGHSVASAGPYRIVRHPAYIGTILFELATPLLLGSFWALIPGALSAVIFVVRTALEDRTLITELPGYREFTRQTRYRLIPGIW
ncbi:MAG: isoprenylcysteine carboxylmethyltransferase family protein [Anaerolineae bacterium]|nr:isoprenylcysteine carboxylmethyltransferase family protein [Anaerolineae bacterium]